MVRPEECSLRIPGEGEDSGGEREGFRGEGERDSGLKVNSDSDGEGERFSPEPGMAFTMPGMFSTGTATLDIIPAQ
jgi:hypothetical protein